MKQCVICGAVFAPYRPQAVVCGPLCRRERENRQLFNSPQRAARRVVPKERQCAVCSKPFLSVHAQKRTCSPRCSRERKKEATAQWALDNRDKHLAGKRRREKKRRTTRHVEVLALAAATRTRNRNAIREQARQSNYRRYWNNPAAYNAKQQRWNRERSVRKVLSQLNQLAEAINATAHRIQGNERTE